MAISKNDCRRASEKMNLLNIVTDYQAEEQTATYEQFALQVGVPPENIPNVLKRPILVSLIQKAAILMQKNPGMSGEEAIKTIYGSRTTDEEERPVYTFQSRDIGSFRQYETKSISVKGIGITREVPISFLNDDELKKIQNELDCLYEDDPFFTKSHPDHLKPLSKGD